MKRTNIISLSRFLLYTGTIIQLTYILINPISEISTFILFSTAIIISAAYIDLSLPKKELVLDKTKHNLDWGKKRKRLQKYYNNENNVNKSFSESLQKIQLADSHNERISKILNNYQKSNKKFKIKLNRKSENYLDQYLQE